MLISYTGGNKIHRFFLKMRLLQLCCQAVWCLKQCSSTTKSHCASHVCFWTLTYETRQWSNKGNICNIFFLYKRRGILANGIYLQMKTITTSGMKITTGLGVWSSNSVLFALSKFKTCIAYVSEYVVHNVVTEKGTFMY